MGHCEAIDTTGDDTQLIPWDHWAHTGPRHPGEDGSTCACGALLLDSGQSDNLRNWETNR